MEGQINSTSVEEVQTEVNKTTEVKAKEEVKTFTQEEVDKMISKRLQRERKDIEAKIEKERLEAEELAKLSEADRQRKLFEKQVAEFEETKKAFENEKLLNETSKQLASKNLPIEFAEMLKGNDAESTFENIKVFEEKFNAALEVKVNERLKGNVPKVATTQSNNGVKKEDFKKLNMAQRLKLKNENPSLYEELTN